MKKANLHKFSEGVEESYKFRGRTYWRPSLAYPFFTTKGLPIWKRFNEKNWRPLCVCGLIFPTLEEYNAHYRSEAEANDIETIPIKKPKG